MRQSSIVCSVLLGFVSLTGCASQPESKEVSEAEMMKNWTAFMTPGPAHKVLDGAVGSWTTHMKYSMTPGGPMQESDGTSDIEWVMGGRYIHESAHGSAMGHPFEGAGVFGFDNIKKKYVGGWIDNMGTGLMTSEGTYDASKKALTYMSSGPDASVTKYVPMRTVQTFVDANHFKLEMYAPDTHGKEYKSMEIVYSRSR
jgi:hypothetical protein